jgi:hypothetical protein
MFTVILSIGIGNLLMALANLVDRQSGIRVYSLHAVWLILLLLLYLNLFWQSIDIFRVEDWHFLSFLYVVAGPILILFATNILAPDSPVESREDRRALYFTVSPQFFFILILTQVWGVGIDWVMGDELTAAAGFNLAAGILLLPLALSKRVPIHTLFTAALVLLFLLVLTLRGAGVV